MWWRVRPHFDIPRLLLRNQGRVEFGVIDPPCSPSPVHARSQRTYNPMQASKKGSCCNEEVLHHCLCALELQGVQRGSGRGGQKGGCLYLRAPVAVIIRLVGPPVVRTLVITAIPAIAAIGLPVVPIAAGTNCSVNASVYAQHFCCICQH
jgi:hypothetical protein